MAFHQHDVSGGLSVCYCCVRFYTRTEYTYISSHFLSGDVLNVSPVHQDSCI